MQDRGFGTFITNLDLPESVVEAYDGSYQLLDF